MRHHDAPHVVAVIYRIMFLATLTWHHLHCECTRDSHNAEWGTDASKERRSPSWKYNSQDWRVSGLQVRVKSVRLGVLPGHCNS